MSDSPRCLVLGGTGFIGSHLVDALLALGYRVRCFGRTHGVFPPGNAVRHDARFEMIYGDFMHEADVAAALRDCDVCFHLVSTTLPKSSNADPIFDITSNVLGTVRLLTHAVEFGLKKIVFVSSGGTIYGIPERLPIPETHPTNPVCSYGITKLTIEKYLGLFHQLHGLDYSVLRIANPFGERQRVHASQGAIAVFMGKVLCGEPVEIWGDGSIVRDYIHIGNVIDALLAAMTRPTHEHIFNVGSGQGQSVNDILDAIERVTGRTARRVYLPGRPFDVPRSVLSIDLARTALGWSPKIDFECGLRRFARWIEDSA